MRQLLLKLWNDEEGAEMVEWVIVVAAIAAVAAAAYALIGESVSNKATDIIGNL